ncbi:molybdopterin-dependent oxidoreductase [Bacterioplanoides sp.]|uniref:molybdopterin-dependent oxidoreductase n=1 Tax=Bacterioplanoides sp. TaxID=2066072 RepID=UPI003B0005C7
MKATQQRIHKRTCCLCEATCGIEITLEETQHGLSPHEQIVSIKGDKDDPFSRGYICPKATALQDLHNDPDRLTKPVKKLADGSWQEISWKQAIAEATAGLKKAQQQYGKNAVGSYLGNPNVHNYGNLLTSPMLLRAIGSRNKFSATSVDQLPHHVASYFMLGHQLLTPIPDIDRTDFMLVIGGNPVASNGSMMTVPDIKNRLKAIDERGGKVVLVDPRRNETAKFSHEHVFIRPGQDVLMLLSLLYIFTHESELPTLPDYVVGSDLKTLSADFSPEITAAKTGVPAQQLRSIAAQWLTAKSAVCYGRMGVSVQQYGGLCQWLINLLNIVSGNFDRPGGVMFTQPAIDLPAVLAARGSRGHYDLYRSRVRDFPEFGGEFPVALLAEEILTPANPEKNETAIKAMLVIAGNPALSTPNSTQLNKAFESLDFMVCVDNVINATTRHADIILPPVSHLQRDHYDLIFNNFSVRNVAKYSEPLFKPSAEEKEDWQIILSLAEGLNAGPVKKRLTNWLTYQGIRWLKPKGLLNKMLKAGKSGLDLPALQKQPQGIDLGALQPTMPQRLFHKDKKLQLTPDIFANELQRVKADLLADSDAGLLLIGRRHIRSNNSWMHNSQRLIKGADRCTLMLSETDAEQYGITNGEAVVVQSRTGSLIVDAEITDELMPGVVSLPHGYGHNLSGVQMQNALQKPGVNANELTDDLLIDELTGNTALNGVPITIKKVQGEAMVLKDVS